MNRRRWSIRRRLVAIMVGLLLLAFLLSGGAVFGAVQDWRSHHVDELLTGAAGHVATTLSASTTQGAAPRLAEAVGVSEPLWHELARRGDVPAFFQLRQANGPAVATVAMSGQPTLPEPLVTGPSPGDQGPDDARFVSVTDTEGTPWRARVAPVSSTSDNVLVVAQRDTATTELITRVRNVLAVTSTTSLVVLAVLSAVLVRRGLRPLDHIAMTATAIGAGDLTRRVAETDERTEVGRLEQALNAMLGQLDRAFGERTRSQDRLRRFVADASHELRTPVATIRGYAELFRRGAAQRPTDLAEAMARIESEATRMGALVDELLMLASLDASRPEHRDRVDLAALALTAVDDARAIEPQRSISLDIEDDNDDLVVIGDETRLAQVLTNLLSNVRAHTPVSAPAVVRLRGNESSVELEVVDGGPGLTQTERERVFERFYQARGRTDRVSGHGGAGLGLSIVAAVVAAHGGRTTVSSSDRGGCAFLVVVPRRGDDTPTSDR
jgi:two-component system OmpR family sensor kinase